MTEHLPYKNELRDRLIKAAAGRAGRRRRLDRITGAGLIIVLCTSAAVFAMQLRPSPSSASALTVERSATEVRVTVQDLEATPEQVQRELRAAGLQASVRAVPASPSAVGKFVTIVSSESSNDASVAMDEAGSRWFSISGASSGSRLEIHFGRAAHGDEEYEKSVDAFLPGEPLNCVALRDRPAPIAAVTLSRRGFDTKWQRYTASGFISVVPNDDYRLLVTRVLHTAENELVVYVASPGESPFVGEERSIDCGEQSTHPSS